MSKRNLSVTVDGETYDRTSDRAYSHVVHMKGSYTETWGTETEVNGCTWHTSLPLAVKALEAARKNFSGTSVTVSLHKVG